MRLIKLTMTAFGPYRQKQEIDFQSVCESGIYLISGDTGSGKTSIFDAISFALYGRVSGERKSSKTLKCDLASLSEYCSVKLVFSINGKEYTIQRAPEQIKKKRGGGVTNISHRAELLLPTGERINKLSDIQSMIENDIIGIDLNNFEKLVMLPQGEFQKLLREQSGDRTKTLRKIFGTHAYSLITKHLFDKANELERETNIIFDRCKQIVLAVDSLDKETKSAMEEDRIGYSSLLNKIKRINQEHAREKRRLNAQLSDYSQEQEQIDREILSGNRALEIQKTLHALREEKSSLQNQFLQFGEMKEYVSKCAAIERSVGYEAAVQETLEEKRSLERKHKAISEKMARSEEFLSDLLTEMGRDEQIGLQIKKMEEQLFYCEKLISCLASEAKIQKQLNLLQGDLRRFGKIKEYSAVQEEIVLLEKQIERKQDYLRLQKQLKAAKEKADEAESRYNRSWELFLKGQAGLLASGLRQGEPCPVCGATDHIQYTFCQSDMPTENEIAQLKEDHHLKLGVFLDLQRRAAQFCEDSLADETAVDVETCLVRRDALVQQRKALSDCIGETSVREGLDDRITALENEKIVCEAKEEMLLKEIKELSKRFSGETTETGAKIYSQKLKASLRELCDKRDGMQDKQKRLEGDIQLSRGHLMQISQSEQQIEQKLLQNKERLSQSLSSMEMNYQDFLAAKERLPLIKKMKKEMEESQKKIEGISSQESLLVKELQSHAPSAPLEALERKKEVLVQKKEDLQGHLGRVTEVLAVEYQKEKELEALCSKHTAMLDAYGTIKKLSVVARGGKKRMGFEKYALASYFDDVIAFANLRLEKMSQYRYRLSRIEDVDSDGLDLEVFDCYTGKARHISTLSGGETFVASLALSLGLSDMISHNTGGISLDCIMIDEGFGALDPTYLNNVVSSLRQMENTGCQIGIISHVSDLKRLIPAQIQVERGDIGEGSSVQCFGKS